MRLDKYLKTARILKRRTVSKAVSYTHLDVYKRQLLGGILNLLHRLADAVGNINAKQCRRHDTECHDDHDNSVCRCLRIFPFLHHILGVMRRHIRDLLEKIRHLIQNRNITGLHDLVCLIRFPRFHQSEYFVTVDDGLLQPFIHPIDVYKRQLLSYG